MFNVVLKRTVQQLRYCLRGSGFGGIFWGAAVRVLGNYGRLYQELGHVNVDF